MTAYDVRAWMRAHLAHAYMAQVNAVSSLAAALAYTDGTRTWDTDAPDERSGRWIIPIERQINDRFK